MSKDVVMGFIRHVLTMMGGVFIAKGWVTEAMWPELLGAVMTLVGFVASYWAKDKKVV